MKISLISVLIAFFSFNVLASETTSEESSIETEAAVVGDANANADAGAGAAGAASIDPAQAEASDEGYSGNPNLSRELVPQSETMPFAGDATGQFNIYYYSILFGPSVSKLSSYQPSAGGDLNRNLPVILKNFVSFGYNVTNEITVAPTVGWSWEAPQKGQLTLQDPFLRVAHNSLYRAHGFNLYADVRLHPGISPVSRAAELQFGIQSVQALSYEIPEWGLTLGTSASIRYNQFGSRGWGNDWEYYLGPNMNYRLSPTVAFSMFYELQASHFFGNAPLALDNQGTGLSPGISWDVTPRLNLNPFLDIKTGGRVNLDSTSLGMMLSWVLL